jgi:hypothetical protein
LNAHLSKIQQKVKKKNSRMLNLDGAIHKLTGISKYRPEKMLKIPPNTNDAVKLI